jgi:hypothetical protein
MNDACVMWDCARKLAILLSNVAKLSIHNIASFITVSAVRISGVALGREINVDTHLRMDSL